MTDLEKRIARRTKEHHDYRRKRLVVLLIPGEGLEPSKIGVREERTRKIFSAPVAAIYRQLIRWEIEHQKQCRKAKGDRQ